MSNSLAVNWTSSPKALTVRLAGSILNSPKESGRSDSTGASSRFMRRITARTLLTSSCGLKGLTT